MEKSERRLRASDRRRKESHRKAISTLYTMKSKILMKELKMKRDRPLPLTTWDLSHPTHWRSRSSCSALFLSRRLLLSFIANTTTLISFFHDAYLVIQVNNITLISWVLLQITISTLCGYHWRGVSSSKGYAMFMSKVLLSVVRHFSCIRSDGWKIKHCN